MFPAARRRGKSPARETTRKKYWKPKRGVFKSKEMIQQNEPALQRKKMGMKNKGFL